MSSSSPADLAVTFRSVARRLREARGDDTTPTTAHAEAELQDQIAAAARLVGSLADPLAVADAIEAVPADGWDVGRLDSLRTTALDVGRLLRHISALAEA